jgi:hypothetical protein
MTGADGGNPYTSEDFHIDDTTEASEKLRFYSADSADARTTEFAHLLAERINSGIVPMGFIMAASLLIYDLEKGVNGFTGEPISSGLVGLSDAEYLGIQRAIPDLARIAFPENFADEVKKRLADMGFGTPDEAIDGEDLTDGEIITTDIDTIDEAYRQIVIDARERVLDLDWDHFGISSEDAYKLFEATYGIVLRQAPYLLPLNLLVDEPDKERGLLLELPEDKKMKRLGNYWLAMTATTIRADYATFTRDHLILKVPEVILGWKHGGDLEAELLYLAGSEDPARSALGRAATRIASFISANPSLLKEGEEMPQF